MFKIHLPPSPSPTWTVRISSFSFCPTAFRAVVRMSRRCNHFPSAGWFRPDPEHCWSASYLPCILLHPPLIEHPPSVRPRKPPSLGVLTKPLQTCPAFTSPLFKPLHTSGIFHLELYLIQLCAPLLTVSTFFDSPNNSLTSLL